MKLLKKFLEDSSWTQRMLADRCEIGEDTLSKILNGRRIPTLQVLTKIAKITGLPIELLAKEAESNRRQLS